MLHNGVAMPAIIMSTYGMDYSTMKQVVAAGLKVGYRAFDTARDYGNEHIVGRVLRECLEEQGLQREDIFITTKIGNSQQKEGNIEKEIEISLKNLQTDYVDCWLMHWPYPDYYIDTYHKMEKVYQSGRVHAIGICNCRIRHFLKLWTAGFDINPHCVQFELHPLRISNEIVRFCQERQIAIQAYSPLCRMMQCVRNSPILQLLAERYHKSIAQIILRWHVQRGSVPVFKSASPARLAENYAIWDFELTAHEMEQILSMDEDYKFLLESSLCPGY